MPKSNTTDSSTMSQSPVKASPSPSSTKKAAARRPFLSLATLGLGAGLGVIATLGLSALLRSPQDTGASNTTVNGTSGASGNSLANAKDTPDASDSTVATVNGSPIDSRDFYHRLEVASGPQVLQQMVNEEVLLQFARSQGGLAPDSEVESRLATARKQPNFAATLKNSRQTEDDVRRGLRLSLSQARVVGKGITLSDAEVQAFYRKNSDPKNPSALYYAPASVQLAVIVTPSDKDARQAIADLSAGASFAQVAANYSKDPSAAKGGLLDPIQKGRSQLSQLPQLEEAVFKMKVGQQMNLVKIGNSWWTMRCVGQAPATTVPFAKIKAECRTAALIAKGTPKNGARVQAALAAFQKSAKVTPVWPQYQPASGAAKSPMAMPAR